MIDQSHSGRPRRTYNADMMRTRHLATGLCMAAILPFASPVMAQVSPTTGEAAAGTADSGQLLAVYDQAFDALLRGDFAAAASGFDQVAAQSVNGERIAAARELARLARTMMSRGLTIRSGTTAPGAATATVHQHIPEDDRPGAGRTEVIASTTLASFYSGFVLNVLLDVDDFQAGALVVTAATGAGFAGSLLATRDRNITAGMASSYSLGLGLGLANGILLAHPLGAETEDGFLSIGLGSAALGATAGMIIGDRTRPTRAQVGLTGLLSMMGVTTSTLGTLIVADGDNLDGDTVLVLAAAGLDAGLVAGMVAAPRIDWSSSRAGLVSLSAFLGAVGGFGGAAIAIGEPDSDTEGRVYAGTVLAGMWSGLAMGIYFTRDMKPDGRFAQPTTPPVTVVPTVVEGGGGLGIAGQF